MLNMLKMGHRGGIRLEGQKNNFFLLFIFFFQKIFFLLHNVSVSTFSPHSGPSWGIVGQNFFSSNFFFVPQHFLMILVPIPFPQKST